MAQKVPGTNGPVGTEKCLAPMQKRLGLSTACGKGRGWGIKGGMTRATGKYEPPDGPGSVGWTRPQWVTLADASNPFALQSGRAFAPVKVEYETYGELSPARDNAILVTHALSGDAHAAGWDAAAAEMPDRAWRQRKPGWWDTAIGPGKPLDTRRFFVICANVLGSCYGSTGPSSPDPAGGQPYGLRFPTVTIGDWVRLQARLLDHLGVERLYAVVGGSLGGQQALEWALAFPDRVARAIVLAAAPRLSAQGTRIQCRRPLLHSERSAFSERRLLRRPRPARGSGGGAHAGAYHLSFRAGHAPQIRPQPPRGGGSRLRRRDAVRGRKLPHAPGPVVRGAV